QRKTVLNKMAALCERMQYRPYRFVRDFHPARDAHKLADFKHRTFQPIDARWFTRNLGAALRQHETVENLFATKLAQDAETVETAIQGFSEGIMGMSPETPRRLQKHLARPATGSACKRLNMYLRWMVRPGPVDLGIWTKICPDQLVLPLDVHAGRQARALGLVSRKQNDWRAAFELTANCRLLCPDDPARYDFAFFGVGAYDEALDPRFTDANALTFAKSPTER
ncbi:MAG TPA: TIGR02757 family protein, partial [Rhodothermales bacterium]|nr:TIGR02757 family protein [Rhodothermales bacterium]